MNHRSACARCEQICDTPLVDQGTLHLQFPLTHTFDKARSLLGQRGHSYTEQDGLLSIPVQQNVTLKIVQSLQTALTPREQADVRVLFQQDGKAVDVIDSFTVTTLPGFAARLQSGWLADLLREDRLTSAFQPIVDVRMPEKVFAYELLMRGVEGNQLISPIRMLEVARCSDMLFQLDLAGRLAAIRSAAKYGLTTKVFINFNPTAIYDPGFCLRSTAQKIEELGLSNEQIVFEVVESDHVDDLGHLKNIVNHYRGAGIQVALDDLGSGFSSLNMLHELRPDYVKLDMQLIRNIHQDPYKASITRKLLEAAHDLGIQTITEGVETIDEYSWIRAHGADFAQGYLFAKPALVPPTPHVPQLG